MKMPERIKVESNDNDGKKVTVYIQLPNSKVSKESQLAYNRTFRDAIQSGAVLRRKLDDVLIEQGVWSEEKENRYQEILVSINENEKKIASGGIKLSEAKQIALEMRDSRAEFRNLIAERTQMDSSTAEGQADNARFNYLCFACILDENGEKLFESQEDYENDTGTPYVVEAARVLAERLYGLDANFEKNLPENTFLSDYKFVDDELRLIDEDGNLVNRDGERVNELGYRVDEDGKLLSHDGIELDDKLRYKMDFVPFLDEDGKEVTPPNSEEAEAEAEETEIKEPKKRRGRPPKKAATNNPE
tara:strand:+ start:14736 stop:15644 length:909 start_codon:yes stop_codon:yes gene_type:complete